MRNIIFANNLPTIEQLTRILVMEALRRAAYDYKAASRMIGMPVLELTRIHGPSATEDFQGMAAPTAV
jgi:hypothetical protein